MITSQDIIALFDIAGIQVPASELRDDERLANQGVDSMDMAVLIHEVEVAFGVMVTTEDAARLRTLRDIAEFVNRSGSKTPRPT